jgi:arylsulfatase A-like enzyme
MQVFTVRFLSVLTLFVALNGFAAGKASHVVVMVWDGMRADFVSPETTPNLVALASNGVTFLHHHPVYPSLTEANGTAIATGSYPRDSSLLANKEYRATFNRVAPIGTDGELIIRKGDEMTGNHYLAVSTTAEILQKNGIRTAIAGSKPVAMLHDRALRGDDALGVDIYAGNVLPKSMARLLTKKIGRFPKIDGSKIHIDRWTTQAMLDVLWQKDVPPFSLLWMAEPDYSQHQMGPGSPGALAAIKSSDENLDRVLKALDNRGLRDTTDVIVVSDHGFSTIKTDINLAAILKTNGFPAYDHFPKRGPADGDIMVVGNGGETSFYVAGHSHEAVTRLIHFLQTLPYTGVVFSQQSVEGTFPLSDAGLDTAYAPDVAIAVRWTAEQSQYGAPGMIYDSSGGLHGGQGQHASLDPFDMHNICFAAGPDFVAGMNDSLPSGNMDIAPTVLWILGVTPEQKMSGRVLSEALNSPAPAVDSFMPRHKEASWSDGQHSWRQYLDTSVVNGEVYLDQGNGGPAIP